MTSTAPIGVFDSGLGGLTVVGQIRRDMPGERVLYFGDSAYAPYGTRTPDYVRSRCFAIADDLLARGIKALVVACNTATSVCIEDLRRHCPIPVVGMEPALKVACDAGGGTAQRVIVAATPLTLRERKFATLMTRFKARHSIHMQPCPDLVELVESGRLDDRPAVFDALRRYFGGYDLQATDSVVLGCTHFVFFARYFREFLQPTVSIVDGNEGTVRHLRDLLMSRRALAPATGRGGVDLRNSDASERMRSLSHQLLESQGQR